MTILSLNNYYINYYREGPDWKITNDLRKIVLTITNLFLQKKDQIPKSNIIKVGSGLDLDKIFKRYMENGH